MAQWRVELYGTVDDADDADDAIDDVLDAAKGHGLSGGTISSPNRKRDIGPDGVADVDAAGRPVPATDKGEDINEQARKAQKHPAIAPDLDPDNSASVSAVPRTASDAPSKAGTTAKTTASK